VGQSAHVHDHGFHLATHSLATCALNVATTTSSSSSSSSSSQSSSPPSSSSSTGVGIYIPNALVDLPN